jgi:para-nitrobenzyl esterase
MRKIRGSILLVFVAIASAVISAAGPSPGDPTFVAIDSGAVHGSATADVVSFKGIPYAEPPVGPLRWRMPQPVKPWEGVRETTNFGPSCMQTDDVPKSEDCLTLNVWRPAADSATPLPVMVWIHGGALVHGGTSIYPGGALARQGVVVVSMNYRMGRLGFFAHPALAAEAPGDVRGNYGIMDQRAALEWVQRNIAAFGGDPKQVTIFGESAGGGSVMVHLTAPLSRGLFHRAILQSPGIPTARARVLPLTELADAEKMAVDYTRSVGVTGDGTAALAGLRALPASRLIERTSAPEVIAAQSAGACVIGFAGTIRDGRLIVAAPEEVLAKGRQAMVPVMVGADDRDLDIGTANSKDELFALFGPYVEEARKLYDPKGSQTLDELKQQVFADKTFVEPSRHLANEMVRAGLPTWWYRFSYVAESMRGTVKGTLHGLELPYTFNVPAALVGGRVTAADKAMGDLASAYWVAFGKTGDPNGGRRPTWPRHDPAVDRVIDFTNTGVVVGPDPLKARLDLWKKVWEQPRTKAELAGTCWQFVKFQGDLY